MIPFLDEIALTSEQVHQEVEFLIQDFLPKNMITMYYADGGNAKTWLSYGVAAHLCRNELARVVYYLDLDNPLVTLKERKTDELLIERFSNLKYVHRSDLKETPLELLEKLAHKDNSKDHAYKDMVLIIDSFRNTTNIMNNEKAMYMMNLLMDIREAGMTILGIAHSNKDGKNYEGSNNIKNSLDVMFKQKLLQKVMGEYVIVNLEAEKERAGVRSCDWKICTQTLNMTQADPIYSRMNDYEESFVSKGKEALLKYPEGLGQTPLLNHIGYEKTDHTARATLEKFEGKFWNKVQEKKGTPITYTLI